MDLCKIKAEPRFFAKRLLTVFLSYLTLLYCHLIRACYFSPLHYCWYGFANGPEFHWPGILKYSPQHDEMGRGLRWLKPVLLGSASSGKTPASQNCSRQHTGPRKPFGGLVSHLGIMVGLSPAVWHVPISPSKADSLPTTPLASWGLGEGPCPELLVLVSAGTELTLFLVAGTVLCFGFSVRMMLITR